MLGSWDSWNLWDVAGWLRLVEVEVGEVWLGKVGSRVVRELNCYYVQIATINIDCMMHDCQEFIIGQ